MLNLTGFRSAILEKLHFLRQIYSFWKFYALLPTFLDFSDYARRKPVPIGTLDYEPFIWYIFVQLGSNPSKVWLLFKTRISQRRSIVFKN